MAGIFRLLWHKPVAHNPHIERKVSWLELFYDLVYVVAVAQLAHHLAAHPSLEALGQFMFLFLPIFFAWQNGAYYHDYYETNDISIRIFTFIQLLAVIGMAIHAHDALGEGSRGFAIAYIFHHLFMTILWWRTGFHDEEEGLIGKAQKPWLICYSISVLLFIASLFVEAPTRFYFWGAALLFDLAAPTVAALSYGDGYAFAQKTSEKLRERFGLFAILVLGESIAGVVNGMLGIHDPGFLFRFMAIGSALVAFLLWWIYFDTVANREVKPGVWNHDMYMYSHLALYMGLTCAGAGILDLVKHADGHHAGWLLLGATGASLIILSIMERALEPYEDFDEKNHHRDATLKLISGVILIVVAFFSHNVSAPLLLICLILALMAVVGYIAATWVRYQMRLGEVNDEDVEGLEIGL